MELKDQSLFRQQCYIDGAWIDADSGETQAVSNPATGEQLGTVPKMGAAETKRAIEAANAAWGAWRGLLAKERANILRNWFNLMIENTDDLAVLMTAEQGKPLAEAKGEIVYAASFIEWFAEEGKRMYGDTIPQHGPDKRIVVIKEPIGVVAAITPWNFPSAMITRKAGPALAAGCPFVIKPASDTPYSALALAELAERAGIPKGVFSVITGASGAIGGEMTSNPIVRKLSFTGSTEIGKVLMKQCADTVKKTSMELGGNAPFIVFNDADIDSAVAGAMASKYRNTGQTCVCANRLYIQDGVYDEFTEKLTAAVKAMVVGDGLKGDTQQGPLINMAAVEKVEEHVEDAVSKGAKVVCGGKRHELGGTFFEPTIMTDVTQDMLVARDETFGPLAPLFRFTDDADVVRMSNDTEFGLACYFYSRDIGRIWRTAEALEYGIVGINTGIISTEVAPFGGMKESGTGREGSKYGIDDYCEIKYMCMGDI
ncbi:MAG: NADP-dependent succinate-semialdehyde dehydrogenase [Rhodospirillales bacterium]|jgi:succinate-semialdehyde dehydrogenase / glutarate-semialdehyde dehydrogenase|nr:NADP-dependent succinate-semialdehyde dehydrogenase [Rhodospirillales bacterium]MBT4039929.1 NADP-dependent succinate-semialdehyde dehydrogenase [Rhodospirillales bacterium]MBT4625166.1 NADP-dependent succinate-semialdehyde dehydrogenase [Rhodospirillales bacterium]MBT5351316.1 NADP-dependent succinate-semialdehyde dehydrogenase [Rhodospirillales bacterium]MBT5521952.1 NADP-dependent succinate-semialdehyde dehydrogenase [Rhodospirillales bacterium]